MKTTEPDYHQLDHDVARLIMGWPEGLLANPHFPLPQFSTSRDHASLVLEKLIALGGDVPLYFDEAVLAMESDWLRAAPLHVRLFCITPDMICQAGLAAIKQTISQTADKVE